MTDGKPRRTRRSAEQMLVELKQRLREISDLNAAGSLLNWDQATYMPQAGAGALPSSSIRRVINDAFGRQVPTTIAIRSAATRAGRYHRPPQPTLYPRAPAARQFWSLRRSP